MKHVYISHYYYTNITARKNFEHSHRTRKRNVDPFTRMKDTEFGEWNTQKYVEPNEDVSTSIKYVHLECEYVYKVCTIKMWVCI